MAMTVDELSAHVHVDAAFAAAASRISISPVRFPRKKDRSLEEWEMDRWGDVATVNGDKNPFCDGGVRSPAVAAHMARHDPKREAAEVALKRLILEEHEPHEDLDGGLECLECSDDWPCDYIKALQAIYEGNG